MLPLHARLRATDERVLVTGADGGGLVIDRGGPFAPEADLSTVPADALDLSTLSEPLVRGDLPLDQWRPDGDGALLETPAAVRGVELPAGASLQAEPSGVLTAVVLPVGGGLGGQTFAPGALLTLAQGCDFTDTGPDGAERCWLVEGGRLVAP